MGICGSKDKMSANDRIVQKALVAAQKKEAATIKLLFLGTGDSGKTTVFKQMRILYGSGYSPESRKALAPAIIANLINGTKSIINACEGLADGHPLRRSESKRAAHHLQAVTNNQVLTPDIAKAIQVLWRDKDFQATWEQRSKFQILEGYGEFASQVKDYPVWGGPDWTPSLNDAIRARVRTSGIVEENFLIDGVNFKMFDVGGQRNERRKWIHCFDNVTAVIFVAAISEYNQFLFEDKSQNRVVEALELFKDIANSTWFTDSVVILFLNKIDLFKEKYCHKKVPLNASGFFPDAPKDPQFKFETAARWLQQRFLRQSNRQVYCHFTCAIDTDYVNKVFSSCKDAILRKSLKNSGFMD